MPAFERTHHHAHLPERARVADVMATGKLLHVAVQMLEVHPVMDALVPRFSMGQKDSMLLVWTSPRIYSMRLWLTDLCRAGRSSYTEVQSVYTMATSVTWETVNACRTG